MKAIANILSLPKKTGKFVLNSVSHRGRFPDRLLFPKHFGIVLLGVFANNFITMSEMALGIG